MKKLLIGTVLSLTLVASASAADLAPAWKAPPPEWNWTGFYIGAQGGAGWGDNNVSVTGLQACPAGVCGSILQLTPAGFARNSYQLTGLHGGGTAGFNWQAGRVVFGVEGDISAANLDGSNSCSLFFTFAFGASGNSCERTLTSFGTATGRLGLTVHDALVYIKAGGAFGHYNINPAFAFVTFGPGGTSGASAVVSDNRFGFTVGSGIEYAIWGGWSAKVEYNYLDFGNKSLVYPLTGPFFGPGNVENMLLNARERVNVVRAGLNYRFDWGRGPVFTRY